MVHESDTATSNGQGRTPVCPLPGRVGFSFPVPAEEHRVREWEGTFKIMSQNCAPPHSSDRVTEAPEKGLSHTHRT